MRYQPRIDLRAGGPPHKNLTHTVVSLDRCLAAAVEQMEELHKLLAARFEIKEFAHSPNVYQPGSDLRVQIQTDARCAGFLQRARSQMVLGLELPVATLEDTLSGKVRAALDPGRRASKRQKHLADIARQLAGYPHLRSQAPPERLARLL